MSIDSQDALHLAQAVLAVHFVVAAFVVIGMIAIPIGGRLAWPPVFVLGWRLAHLGTVAIIAAQKLLGQTCFLSVWEFELMDRAGQAATSLPVIHRLGLAVMHWNMPDWFFAALYTAILIYVAALWWLVPPRR